MFSDKEARAGLNTVQDELAELKDAVFSSKRDMSALACQMTSLADDLADFAGRHSESNATVYRQRELLDNHRQQLDVIASDILATQQLIDKLSTRVERMQRQATIDNREMRDNYAALAVSIRLLQGNG